MPLGYTKLRDALIRQGLSEEEAKTKAARIWNSKHKGDEAVGGHYDAAHGLQTPSNKPSFNLARGDQLAKVLPDFPPALGRGGGIPKGGQVMKEAVEALRKKKPKTSLDFTGILSRPSDQFGMVLLGVPSDVEDALRKRLADYTKPGEEALQKRLAELTKKGTADGPGLFAKSQTRVPLSGPLAKYPTPGPGTNPNAVEAAAMDQPSGALSGTDGILDWLKKRNAPKGPKGP